MLIYFLRRIALTIPTFIALMFLTFVAIRMVPGDPVEVRVGEHGISAERLAYFRHELGLDQPVWKQFLHYAWRLLHGDFGVSLATQQKVLTEFLTLFPATLELSFFAMLFAIFCRVGCDGCGQHLLRSGCAQKQVYYWQRPPCWFQTGRCFFSSPRAGCPALDCARYSQRKA